MLVTKLAALPANSRRFFRLSEVVTTLLSTLLSQMQPQIIELPRSVAVVVVVAALLLVSLRYLACSLVSPLSAA